MNWRAVVRSPLLALAALAALAVWPLLRAGYPAIGDGLNHFYRLVEFEHLLAHGAWFPRWATDLGYGYGYPLFNYSPPLPYTLGALLHALGLSEAASLLGVYLLAWALAITGAYRLAREHDSPAAGLVAAAAYGLAPYLYFNSLARGALPETLGLGLLPWCLLAYYRLAVRPSHGAGRPSYGAVVGAALLYAALILTHLLTALLALPLVLLFWLIAVAQGRRREPVPNNQLPITNHQIPSTNYKLPIALLIAFALSAYFLLPALLETRYVQISQLTQPGDLDFRNNFLRLGDLLAWPRTFDARLVVSSIPASLSLAALALAVMGLALRAWHSRRADHAMPALAAWDLGLWLGFLGLSLMCLGLTRPVWEHSPGANLIQFPWRLAGPASLLLALLAARAVDVNVGRAADAEPPANVPERHSVLSHMGWIGGLWPALALAALFLYSLTWTFSSGPPPPLSASVRDLAGYERTSGQLGTTSAAEFLPVSVRQLPDPHSLEAAYALHSVIERLGPLPAGVAVESQEATLDSAGAVITAAVPVALTFNFFDFPGWRATVDGAPAPITASTPNGLITVPVPAGRHTVRVSFVNTPVRAAAGLLSLAALAGVAFVGLFWFRSRAHLPVAAGTGWPAGRPQAFPLVCLALLLLRALAIDGHATPFTQSRFDGEHVAGAGQVLDANFDDQLVLIGLDPPPAGLAADAGLPVTLYWRAQNVPAVDYSTTLQVFDAQGNLWGQSDSQNPGRLPTSRWAPGQYARDDHLLRLRPGTPPGTYRLVAGVYTAGGSGAALSVLDDQRVPQGQMAPLGTISVARARWTAAAIQPAQPAHQALGPLTWLGASVSSTTPQAGDELSLETFWRAEGAARPDINIHLALLGADGTAIQVWDLRIARADYPTSAWAPAEIVRSVLRLRIPASAPDGRASLQLSLVPAGGATPVAGPIQVALLDLRAPARSFAIPAMAHVSGESLGGLVKLLGYDLKADQVTLYWQALAPMDLSYTVFVHALGPAGAILAQVDAPPLGGSRPTTGWLPGEVLADRYTLPLTGAATLEVGLFDPVTRQRLGTVSLPLH